MSMPSWKARCCVRVTGCESPRSSCRWLRRHLWAETYESQLGDILTLQSHVTSAIVNEIRVKLTPEDQVRLAATRPVSTQSYENYLKGRYYWNKRSQEGLTKAINYFQVAIEKDPNYALAYAGLADCYSIIGSVIVEPSPRRKWLRRLAPQPSSLWNSITRLPKPTLRSPPCASTMIGIGTRPPVGSGAPWN